LKKKWAVEKGTLGTSPTWRREAFLIISRAERVSGVHWGFLGNSKHDILAFQIIKGVRTLGEIAKFAPVMGSWEPTISKGGGGEVFTCSKTSSARYSYTNRKKTTQKKNTRNSKTRKLRGKTYSPEMGKESEVGEFSRRCGGGPIYSQ